MNTIVHLQGILIKRGKMGHVGNNSFVTWVLLYWEDTVLSDAAPEPTEGWHSQQMSDRAASPEDLQLERGKEGKQWEKKYDILCAK